MRNNPFRPNSPVNPGMFVGRLDEIVNAGLKIPDLADIKVPVLEKA